jgi:phosphocarrier protein
VADGSAPITRVVKIVNTKGLHARASAKFVQTAAKFDAHVSVQKDGHAVSGTSIMGLMMLGAGIGSDIEIRAHGWDAKEALDALSALVEAGFDERD